MTDTEANSQVQLVLKAWCEGHYARTAKAPFDTCPYLGGGEMAVAWQHGWLFVDHDDAAIVGPEVSHRGYP